MAYYHANKEYYKQKYRRVWGKKASRKARHKRASKRWIMRLGAVLYEVYGDDTEGITETN